MTVRARIYQPPKTAMQSGFAGTLHWRLEYVPEVPSRSDALMGWNGGSDTQSQVKLVFDTREEAIAYADRLGILYDVEVPTTRHIKPKAYADNFKFGRTDNWTH